MLQGRPSSRGRDRQSPRKSLREEEHRLGVDREAAIVAVLAHVENVATLQDRDAGVVDQGGERSDRVLGATEQGLVTADVRNVGHDRDDPHALGRDLLNGAVDCRVTFHTVQRDVVAGPRQIEGDRQTDATARPGHQGRALAGPVHAAAPFFSSSRAMIMRWIWFVPS